MVTRKELLVRFRGDTKSLNGAMASARGSINQTERTAEKASRSVKKSFFTMEKAVAGFAAAYAASRITKSIIDTSMQIEALEARMITAVGAAGDVTGELTRLREEAERLGVDFLSSSDNFAQFAAAARLAGLEMDTVRDVFTEVSKAGVALKLSNDQMSGAFTALTQIASKGVVSMEELRQQLGERIPVALSAMAEGLGVTQAELIDMVSKGALPASDGLKALADGFRNNEDLAAAFSESADSTRASINRLNNQFFDLKKELIENSDIMPVLNDGIEGLSDIISSDEFKSGLSFVARSLVGIAQAAALAVEQIGRLNNLLSSQDNIIRSGVADYYDGRPSDMGVQDIDLKSVSQNIESEMGKIFDDIFSENMSPKKIQETAKAIGGNEEKSLKKASEKAEEKLRDVRKESERMKTSIQRIEPVANNAFDGFIDSILRGEDAFVALRNTAIQALRDILRSFAGVQGGSGGLGGAITGIIASAFGGITSNAFGQISAMSSRTSGQLATAAAGGAFGPGFNTGGSFTVRGNSGIDRNTLSLNGQPIANVSKGESVGIGRNGGGTVVNIINNSGAQATQTRSNRGGQEQIDVVIENIVASKINTNGSRINRSLRQFSTTEATRR